MVVSKPEQFYFLILYDFIVFILLFYCASFQYFLSQLKPCSNELFEKFN